MRNLTLCFFLLLSLATAAQREKFSVGLFWRPELTTSRQDISYRWRSHPALTHFNPLGFKTSVRYNFTEQLSAEGGVGFVYRKFATRVFFNQAAIPPPRYDSTSELVTGQPAYGIFEFPIEVGYKVLVQKQISLLVKGGYVFNYLWSANYYPNSSKYGGMYAKRYALGGSAVASAEAELRFTHKIFAVIGGSYLFSNFNKPDPYLFSQDEPVIAIDHRIVSWSLGLRKYF